MYPIEVQHQVLVAKHKRIKGALNGIMDSKDYLLASKKSRRVRGHEPLLAQLWRVGTEALSCLKPSVASSKLSSPTDPADPKHPAKRE